MLTVVRIEAEATRNKALPYCSNLGCPLARAINPLLRDGLVAYVHSRRFWVIDEDTAHGDEVAGPAIYFDYDLWNGATYIAMLDGRCGDIVLEVDIPEQYLKAA